MVPEQGHALHTDRPEGQGIQGRMGKGKGLNTAVNLDEILPRNYL
jgi:hypothetical protein